MNQPPKQQECIRASKINVMSGKIRERVQTSFQRETENGTCDQPSFGDEGNKKLSPVKN